MLLISIFLNNDVEKNEGSLQMSLATDLKSDIPESQSNLSSSIYIPQNQLNLSSSISYRKHIISISHHSSGAHLQCHRKTDQFSVNIVLLFHLEVDDHLENKTASGTRTMSKVISYKNF